MKIFICSMPILALMMIFNHICYYGEPKLISAYDERAEAIFKRMQMQKRGVVKAQKQCVVVAEVLREDTRFYDTGF